MKKYIVGVFIVAAVSIAAGKGIGVLVVQSRQDNVRSAIEVRPTRGTEPTVDALAELVLYRKDKDQAKRNCYERFNISAMHDGEAMYRIGVERGNCAEDEHRPIAICFERIEAERGLPAKCPFIVEADGETVHVVGKFYVNGARVGQ